MITTITSDRLRKTAVTLVSISDAVFEAGFRQEADVLAHAAREVSDAAESIETKLLGYAKSANSEPTL